MSFINLISGNSWKGVIFHLLLVLAAGYALIFYFFNGYLPKETRHGEGITLPSVENMSYMKAKKVLESKGLILVVRDTVYSPKHPRSSIVSQLPSARREVKLGRKIYVDVNRSDTPTVTLTAKLCREGGGLILTDVGTAQITAQNLELVPEIVYIDKPNDNFVYKAKIGRDSLHVGMEIPIGSKIVLFTGNGN